MNVFMEEFEDIKGIIRIRISKKDKQHNGQKKKDKQRSTKHTHKIKDGVTRTPAMAMLSTKLQWSYLKVRNNEAEMFIYKGHKVPKCGYSQDPTRRVSPPCRKYRRSFRNTFNF
jgi:peptidyl-tRNA hydrolase